MDISNKLARAKADRAKRAERVATDKAAIAALDKEIKSLEALEIQYLIQEYHLPPEEVKAMIRDMAQNPTHQEKGPKT